MPRDRAPRSAVFYPPAPTALVASASRKDLKRSGKPVKIRKEAWQERAWYYYDVIGELYYAAEWVSNLISKAKLVVLKNGKPVKSGPAVEVLNALFGGQQGQQAALKEIALHLFVGGETYVVGTKGGNSDDPDEWMIASNLRVQKSGGMWKIDGDDVAGDPLVLRIWNPHPIDPKQATSSVRPALPVLAQLDALGMRVSADASSRLLGAGLLFIPSEVTLPSQPIGGGSPEEPVTARSSADDYQDRMIDVASKAIANPESASARVPLVSMIPGEQIQNVKHLDLATAFDVSVPELTDRAIRRLALSLNMPPEALEGTAEMNHWGAWAMEEAAIKIHSEPPLALIASALTEGILWPALVGESDEDGVMDSDDAQKYAIGVDTTAMGLRPNRSKEAVEMYDRGVISMDAMLRENGFDPDADQMKQEELQTWFIRKVASGSTTPELVAEALKQLGVIMNTDNPAKAAETQEARPTPSLEQHPTRDIPEQDDDPALVASAEVLVYRALERAGNRLKNRLRGVEAPTVSAAELYQHIPFAVGDIDFLLEDAWAPCPTFGVDQDSLDRYARTLLATRAPHSREALLPYLAKVS